MLSVRNAGRKSSLEKGNGNILRENHKFLCLILVVVFRFAFQVLL
jgi:hypothetical protein